MHGYTSFRATTKKKAVTENESSERSFPVTLLSSAQLQQKKISKALTNICPFTPREWSHLRCRSQNARPAGKVASGTCTVFLQFHPVLVSSVFLFPALISFPLRIGSSGGKKVVERIKTRSIDIPTRVAKETTTAFGTCSERVRNVFGTRSESVRDAFGTGIHATHSR